MRVPQVSERVKEVPAQALRGVFAGIGQLLLVTDKLRNKAPADRPAPPARSPGPPAAAPAAGDAAASRDETPAPVRADTPPAVKTQPPVGTQPPAEAPAAPARPRTPAAPKAPRVRNLDKTGNVRLLSSDEVSAAGAAGDAGPTASGVRAEPAAADAPPLPNYDELSVASLRARLRNLDLTQVRRLTEYEKAHAARADVIVMFERRIAKLEAGD